jgi:hypothetical protein
MGHIVPVVRHWDSMAQAERERVDGRCQEINPTTWSEVGESELALRDDERDEVSPSLGNLEFGYFPDAVALARWRVNRNLAGSAAISLRV